MEEPTQYEYPANDGAQICQYAKGLLAHTTQVRLHLARRQRLLDNISELPGDPVTLRNELDAAIIISSNIVESGLAEIRHISRCRLCVHGIRRGMERQVDAECPLIQVEPK